MSRAVAATRPGRHRRAGRHGRTTAHRAGVAVLAAALLALTCSVKAGWWPVSLDRRLDAALPGPQARGLAPVLLQWASDITTLATPQVTVLITVVLTALISTHRSLAALCTTAVSLVVLAGSVLGVKALVVRPGPPGSPLNDVFGYFPSGHTSAALVCTGLLVRLASEGHPRRRRPLLIASWSWTLLVATALVFHRYHWLSDVVAALLLGSLILLLPGCWHRSDPRRPESSAGTV